MEMQQLLLAPTLPLVTLHIPKLASLSQVLVVSARHYIVKLFRALHEAQFVEPFEALPRRSGLFK